jgi:hypothetical protein
MYNRFNQVAGDESDGMDETILPVDFKRAGVITDDVFCL